jgi:hypothetical protein
MLGQVAVLRRAVSDLLLLLLLLLPPVLCSIDIPGMFEAKGVTNASERLQLLVGDVRQPFPEPAREAQVGGGLEAQLTVFKCFTSSLEDFNALSAVFRSHL